MSQFGIRAGFRPGLDPGWRLGDSVFYVLKKIYKIIYIYIIKKNVCEVLLALFCPVTTNSNVSFSMTMSKIIVIHPSTNRVLA